MFRGSFRVLNLRWRVQNLVFPSPAGMIDQRNQLKQVAQCKKCSKSAAEVEKKWHGSAQKIHLDKFPLYVAAGLQTEHVPVKSISNENSSISRPISYWDLLLFCIDCKSLLKTMGRCLRYAADRARCNCHQWKTPTLPVQVEHCHVLCTSF